jgi:hypothetical protein
VSAVAPTDSRASTGARAASRAALDMMLTDAAIEPGAVGRLVAPGAAARPAGGLAVHPRRVGRPGAELTRITAGASRVPPPKGDRRFGDRRGRRAGCSAG